MHNVHFVKEHSPLENYVPPEYASQILNSIRKCSLKTVFYELIMMQQPLSNYLTSTTHPRLLLCCGHQTRGCGSRILVDVVRTSTRNFVPWFDDPNHHHQGWYTIDQDPTCCPDLLMDLTDYDSLAKFAKMAYQSFEFVYIEGWSFYATQFFQMIHQILRSGGHCLMTIGSSSQNEMSRIVGEVGFSPQQVQFMFFPFLHQIRRAFTTTQNIEKLDSVDLNAKSFVQRLIEATPIEERLTTTILSYRIAAVDGRLQKELNHLRTIGFVPSLEYDRTAYLWLTR